MSSRRAVYIKKKYIYIFKQWSRMGLKWQCYVFTELTKLLQYVKWNLHFTVFGEVQFSSRCDTDMQYLASNGGWFFGSGPKSVRKSRFPQVIPVTSSTSWTKKRYRALECFLILRDAQASQQLIPVKWRFSRCAGVADISSVVSLSSSGILSAL